MPLDPDTCYRALRAKDRRFDGLFFVAVSTTGIYCRPICPARTPRRERCSFYTLPAEAERAGFRACFRCRPEVAPGPAPVEALVGSAIERINAGYLNEHSIEDLASMLGVTSRHLRRVTESELGVTPVELAQTRRLALGKQLLQDTRLPLAEVAFAAGFQSIRRFNSLFRARYGRAPGLLRRAHGDPATGITLRLDYRPPLAWEPLLAFLRARAIPGVEEVNHTTYARTVRLGRAAGRIEVTCEPARACVRARISNTLAGHLPELASRLRVLFDLDARPDAIAAHLGDDRLLRPSVKRHPGLRLPGAFDRFETAARAVLGQQISVRGASTLAGRLSERFPIAADVARATEAELRGIGITAIRARALKALATVELDARDPERTIAALLDLPGIGPWTAQYIAMRALHWPDAFPFGDLALRHVSARRAEAWRPWRAYAAMHLWNLEASR